MFHFDFAISILSIRYSLFDFDLIQDSIFDFRLSPRSEGGCETGLTFVSRCRCNQFNLLMRGLLLRLRFRCVRLSILIATAKNISFDNFGCSDFKQDTRKNSTLWSSNLLAPRCRGCKLDAEVQVRAKTIDEFQGTVILSVSYRSWSEGGCLSPAKLRPTDSVNPRSMLTRASPR